MGFSKLEVTLYCRHAATGQTLVNVFGYGPAVGTDPIPVGGLEEYLSYFETWVVDNLVQAVGSGYTYYLANARIVGGVNEDSRVLNHPGLISGPDSVPWVCTAFKIHRTTNKTRNGAKRLAPPPEDQYDDTGQPHPASALEGAIPIVRGALIAYLEPIGFESLAPKIFSTALDVDGKPLFANFIKAATFQRVSSQVSRKPRFSL